MGTVLMLLAAMCVGIVIGAVIVGALVEAAARPILRSLWRR